jgi:hypothetical protein
MMKPNNVTFISVNNGDISVAASREEISADENNVKVISTFCEDAVKDIVELVVEQFNKPFKSLTSYVETYERMSETVNYGHLTLTDAQKQSVFRYTEKGMVFTFDLTNNYNCDKFDTVIKHTLHKKRIKHYLRSDGVTHVQVGPKSVVVLSDEMFSNSVKNQKIRALLGEGFERVYEISCKSGSLTDIQDVCNAKLMSELQYVRKAFNPRTGRIREDGEVQIRFLNTYYNVVKSEGIASKKIDEIEQDDATYVLVPFASKDEKFNVENADFCHMVTFLNNKGYHVVKCGKKDYDALLELDNVLEYDDVVDNIEDHFPLSDDKIRGSLMSNINGTLHSLKRLKHKIVCPMFEELFALYPERVQHVRLDTPDSILIKYYSNYKQIAKELKEIEKLQSAISKRYPLLSCYTANHEEYVYYINGKAQSKE